MQIKQIQISRVLLTLVIMVIFSTNVYSIDNQKGINNPLVKKIEIKGVSRIEEGAIRAVVSQHIGEPLGRNQVADDIKAIYQMGYFRDVRVETEFYEGGIKLIYLLTEKPTIVSIAFHGNIKNDDDLKKEISLVKGSIADNALIQDNVNKLRKFYEDKGYFRAEIFPVITYKSNKEVDIIFEIKEHDKLKIREIVVEGNDKFSDTEIVNSMKSGIWWNGSFMTDSGYVKEQDIKTEPQRILDLYYDNGYIDATVTEPTVNVKEIVTDTYYTKHPEIPGHMIRDKKDGISLNVSISEGLQYKISSVSLSGTSVFESKTIKELIKIKSGDIFSKTSIGEDIKRVSEYYSERGYALVSIMPKTIPDKATQSVSIEYVIDEGKCYKIGRIEIVGNIITRDKVIRREFLLDEGETFDSKKLRRTYEKLMNLNYFEKVDISPKPHTDDNIVDLDVKVKEKSTGFFSIGGGYSTLETFMVFAKITKSNLFGSGQYIAINAQIGGRTTLYEITYQEPWFMDKPLSFSLSVFNTKQTYVDYTKSSIGFSAGFGKRFFDYFSAGLNYRFEDIDVFEISPSASEWLRSHAGKASTSGVTLNIERDSRDNFLDPMSGSRNSVFVTYAGLGGTNIFHKEGIDSIWFFPIEPTTISLRGRYSYAEGLYGKELPIYERYYVGGIYTMRGFDFGAAGPRDSQGTYIGGTTFAILTVEFIFPIFPSAKIKGVAFLDAGRAFNSNSEISFSTFKYSTGTGIRWISPIGPIRIEYGYNLARESGEQTGKLEFAIGGIL